MNHLTGSHLVAGIVAAFIFLGVGFLVVAAMLNDRRDMLARRREAAELADANEADAAAGPAANGAGSPSRRPSGFGFEPGSIR